jgi:anti-sigma B factor antagonist
VSLSSAFEVAVIPERTAVRVAPTGELDIATCQELRVALDELWDLGWTDVVLDLRGLTFMDSSGVQILVENHRRATRTGARFSIIDGPGPVSRVLELTGLEAVFTHTLPEHHG